MPQSKGGRKRPRVTTTADVDAAAVASNSTPPHEEHEDYQVSRTPVVEKRARRWRPR